MKAVICKNFGPPEQLEVGEMDPPELAPAAIRIETHACGVNFPDTLVIENKYQFKAQPPFAPGAEVAGRVIEVGDKVKNFRVGDDVVSVGTHGGYAEQTVVPAATAMPMPRGLSYVEAAAFPMIYGTTLFALKQRAQLQKGETLLVLGAAGGVGMAAIQLGKLMGATVIAAAGSQEKLDACKEQGADHLVNYNEESLKEAVKKLTGGQGADVVYDPVGGDAFTQSLSAIAWNGRILVIGFASGTIPEVALNRILLKNCALVGVFWGAFTMREPKENQENFQQLYTWAAEGKLKPPVSKVYELEEAPQAMRDMLDRNLIGKAVIRIAD